LQLFGVVIGHFLGPCLRTARLILARLQRCVPPHARLTLGRLAMLPISPLAHHRSPFRCVHVPLATNDAFNRRATGVRFRARQLVSGMSVSRPGSGQAHWIVLPWTAIESVADGPMAQTLRTTGAGSQAVPTAWALHATLHVFSADSLSVSPTSMMHRSSAR
jgi:hypothetical protein